MKMKTRMMKMKEMRKRKRKKRKDTVGAELDRWGRSSRRRSRAQGRGTRQTEEGH
jgi:hypothetical protein